MPEKPPKTSVMQKYDLKYNKSGPIMTCLAYIQNSQFFLIDCIIFLIVNLGKLFTKGVTCVST